MTTTITINQTNVSKKSLRSVIINSKPVAAVAKLFTLTNGEKVSNLKAFHVLNATLSFSALLVLGGASVVVAALLLVWFGTAMWQCVHTK